MKWKRGRPYVYTQTVMLRCFVVRMWLRLDSNRALHDFLAKDYYPYNRKVLKACGLIRLPDRRTFDRRLKTISPDIKERISSMGNLFVKEKLVDPYIVSVDSTLLRAKGHLWHKSSIIKRVVYHIQVLLILMLDGDSVIVRDGWMDIWVQTSHNSKYWFSYRTSLSADFTQADVQDNQIYPKITSSLPKEYVTQQVILDTMMTISCII
jgi:hypothetical protein